MTVTKTEKISDTELQLTSTFDAPRAKLFRAWTDPELVLQWFTPKPWTTVRAEFDVRPGGGSLVVMADPEGNEYPNPGLFLDIVENEKIVLTDAYGPGYVPSAKPFMTLILTFEDAGNGQTNYKARVLHWTAEDCKAHEEMGFHEGWKICTDQLHELVARI